MNMAKPKMIRGVTAREYAKLMHDIERGKTTEQALVKKGKLKPSSKGIAPLKRASAKIFSNRNKTRGKGEAGKCRVPDCDKNSSRRGLCNTHRTEAYRMIKRGKTTEKNLLHRGLLLPKASGGTRVTGKKVVKRDNKKTAAKRHKSKRAVSRKRTDKVKFPKKLLNSVVCLYRGCKITRRGGARGLCIKHYSQFKRKREKLSDRQRATQERDLVKRKLLLPRKPKTSKKLKRKPKKRTSRPESSAFDIGATMHGSIRRY